MVPSIPFLIIQALICCREGAYERRLDPYAFVVVSCCVPMTDDGVIAFDLDTVKLLMSLFVRNSFRNHRMLILHTGRR